MAKQSVKPAAEKFPTPILDDAPLIKWAIWCADVGRLTGAWKVFPCVPGEKHPLHKGWQDGATCDPKAVKAMWRNDPNANIGLAIQPGFVAVDVDDWQALEKLEDEHSDFPATYEQRTARGGGHFVCATELDTGNATGKLPKGIDIRGHGGYIVGAGSLLVEKGKEVGRWSIEALHVPALLPEWFGSYLTERKASTDKPRQDYSERIDWDEEQAERLVEAVWDGDLIKDYEGPFYEGERDNLTFQLFAEAKNRMIHPDAVLEVVLGAGIDGGLDDDTVERKMQSAYHDGNTQDGYGSKVPSYWLPNHVFKAYVDGKPIDRPPADPVEWKAANPDNLPKAFPGDPDRGGDKDGGSDPVIDPDARYHNLIRHFEGVLAASGGRERRAIRFGDILPLSERLGASWAIDKWLPRNATNALFGESEAFKTYVTLNMLLCVATGTSFGAYKGFEGYRVDGPRDVILFAGEGYDDVLDRFDAAIEGGGFDRELVEEHLIVVSDVYTLNRADGLAGMADEIDALGARPAIIAVDTYNLALDGNEDGSDEAKRALRGLRALATMYDAAGLVLHHPGWGDTKRPRGSSAFRANSDVMILCERVPGAANIASLTQYKNRSADKTKYRAALVGKPVDLGVDDDRGEAISNLSFSPINPSAIPNARDDAAIMRDIHARHILAALRSFQGKTWTLKDLATEARKKGCVLKHDTLRIDVLGTRKGQPGWARTYPALSPYFDPHSEKWVSPQKLPHLDPGFELKDDEKH